MERTSTQGGNSIHFVLQVPFLFLHIFPFNRVTIPRQKKNRKNPCSKLTSIWVVLKITGVSFFRTHVDCPWLRQVREEKSSQDREFSDSEDASDVVGGGGSWRQSPPWPGCLPVNFKRLAICPTAIKLQSVQGEDHTDASWYYSKTSSDVSSLTSSFTCKMVQRT